jgi:hypothetical protein
MENTKNNKLTEAHNKIDNTLNKGKQAIDSVKTGIQSINEVSSGVKSVINTANDTLGLIKDLNNKSLESEKIAAQTKLGLAKIQANNQETNRQITEAYGKQKMQMDKAGSVVDAGLQDNDIEKIKAGLDSMTKTANTNPLASLKDELDKKMDKNLNQDVDSDDFMLEF